MNVKTIKKLQKENGVSELQEMINSGTAWKMEGFIGRSAMDALKSGACMLPLVSHRDFWGNLVPSRRMVKAGSTGSFQNSLRFWENV